MARRKISRKATTPKGFIRRLQDADFGSVPEPRREASIRHPLVGLLKLGVLGMATGARSTRAVENRSEQLRPTIRADFGLEARVSDNAFGLALQQLDPVELRRALHRQTKAEWRRGNLRPESGPLPWSTVAIDGKHLATIPEKRLRALISKRTGLEGGELSPSELKRVAGTQFPYMQVFGSKPGELEGRVRAHRATLISGGACVALDQWPIRGETNEKGAIRQALGGLFSAYGATTMIEMVTLDAGMSHPDIAEKIREHGAQYFLALKSPQGELYRRARRQLGSRPGREASFEKRLEERGQMIWYTVWTESLEESVGWEDARQIVRIERVVADDEEASVGERYFVTSLGPEKLDAEQAWRLARAHWRCENEGHWTADAIWEEDARRTPWTQHPDGVLVVGLLRAIAINILALLRELSWLKRGDTWVTPTWRTVIEQALLVLCEPLLEMSAFNGLRH